MVEGVITTGQLEIIVQESHSPGDASIRSFALHRYQTYQSSLATNPSHSLFPELQLSPQSIHLRHHLFPTLRITIFDTTGTPNPTS